MTARARGQAEAVGILVSGGVESAALLAEGLARYDRVYPIYVRKGFLWEGVELARLKGLLRHLGPDSGRPGWNWPGRQAGRPGRLAGLTVLEVPLGQVVRPHWSLGKRRVPDSRAPDSAVYLPGRNLLLLSLGGLFCSVRRIPSLWVGLLKGNPFGDARAGFLRRMESVLESALGRPVRISAPLARLSKGQVIRRWRRLPWEKTFSCLSPIRGRHCGRCQKCGERQAGFRAAGVEDPTRYMR